MPRVKLRCPECGTVQEGEAGRPVTCRSCGFAAEIPAPAPPPIGAAREYDPKRPAPGQPRRSPMPSAVGPAPVPGYEALLWPCPRCGSRDVEAVNRPARSHRWLGFLAFGLLWKLVERKAAKGTVQMATRCRACQKEWSTVVDKPT